MSKMIKFIKKYYYINLFNHLLEQYNNTYHWPEYNFTNVLDFYIHIFERFPQLNIDGRIKEEDINICSTYLSLELYIDMNYFRIYYDTYKYNKKYNNVYTLVIYIKEKDKLINEYYNYLDDLLNYFEFYYCNNIK